MLLHLPTVPKPERISHRNFHPNNNKVWMERSFNARYPSTAHFKLHHYLIPTTIRFRGLLSPCPGLLTSVHAVATGRWIMNIEFMEGFLFPSVNILIKISNTATTWRGCQRRRTKDRGQLEPDLMQVNPWIALIFELKKDTRPGPICHRPDSDDKSTAFPSCPQRTDERTLHIVMSCTVLVPVFSLHFNPGNGSIGNGS